MESTDRVSDLAAPLTPGYTGIFVALFGILAMYIFFCEPICLLCFPRFLFGRSFGFFVSLLV